MRVGRDCSWMPSSFGGTVQRPQRARLWRRRAFLLVSTLCALTLTTASRAQAAPLVNPSLSVVAMPVPTETTTATGVDTVTIANTATATPGATLIPNTATATSGATMPPIAATPTITPTPTSTAPPPTVTPTATSIAPPPTVTPTATSIAPPPSPTAAGLDVTATITADETPIATATALPMEATSGPTVGPLATFAPITVTPAPTARAGNLWAWGDISDGSGVSRRSAPIGLTAVVGLAGGVGFNIALRSDGTVWAWGVNYYGQLGDGSITIGSQDFTYPPVQVSGLSGVIAIASGYDHSLALKSDGTVWAWGINASGALGNPAFATCTNQPNGVSAVPTQVQGLSGVVAIAAGASHSMALKSDGTVWAWGDDSFGQLGTQLRTNFDSPCSLSISTSPIQVKGIGGIISIGAGHAHSLAVASDRTVWAWGDNRLGQLGSDFAQTCNAPLYGEPCNPTPMRISGFTGVKAVAGGYYSSMALKSDGTVWTWGSNGYGELGNGSAFCGNCVNAIPVEVPGVTYVAIAPADGSSDMVVKSDGTVWAWGVNANGQLGNSDSAWTSNVPVQVQGLSGAIAIGAGASDGLAVVDSTVATPTLMPTALSSPIAATSLTPSATPGMIGRSTSTPTPTIGVELRGTPTPTIGVGLRGTPTATPTAMAPSTPTTPTSVPASTSTPPTTPTSVPASTSTPTITPTSVPASSSTPTDAPLRTAASTSTDAPLRTAASTSTSEASGMTTGNTPSTPTSASPSVTSSPAAARSRPDATSNQASAPTGTAVVSALTTVGESHTTPPTHGLPRLTAVFPSGANNGGHYLVSDSRLPIQATNLSPGATVRFTAQLLYASTTTAKHGTSVPAHTSTRKLAPHIVPVRSQTPRRHVATSRTQTLYSAGMTVRVDRHGNAYVRMRFAHQVARSLPATLVLAVQGAHVHVTLRVSVTLLPPDRTSPLPHAVRR